MAGQAQCRCAGAGALQLPVPTPFLVQGHVPCWQNGQCGQEGWVTTKVVCLQLLGGHVVHPAFLPGILRFKLVTKCTMSIWLFSFSFVHGRNLHAHQRMSVLQCAYFLCIPTYLLYYLTPLLPPYL